METVPATEIATFRGFASVVWAAAFTPDAQRLATSSSGNEAIKLWSVESHETVLTLEGRGVGFNSVAFSPDGNILAASNGRGVLHIWRAPSWMEIETPEPIRSSESRIKQWLIFEPIALTAGQSGSEGLDMEQLQNEAELRPVPGESTSAKRGEPHWRAVTLPPDGVIDFNAIAGRQTPRSVAYAVCYIRSETEQLGLRMRIGSDDQAKVYLNGRPIYKLPIVRPFLADEDLVENVQLNSGLNVLIFKVVNEKGGWQGSVSITDVQGNPVRGLKITLTP